LLAVFPHPDDETLGLGSTFARYSAEGIETYLACATRGERGWFDSEGPDPGFEGVAKIREGELRCAAGHLGLHDVCFLDYIDGDVDQADPSEIIQKIATQIRRIQPWYARRMRVFATASLFTASQSFITWSIRWMSSKPRTKPLVASA
jgi:LmbE family N-acetylglucosaminyl deacetylase